MKVGNIVRKEICGGKNRFSILESNKSKNFANSQVIKHLFQTYGIDFKLTDVEEVIKEFVSDSLFQTERELNLNNQVLAQKIMRLTAYLNSLGRKIEKGIEISFLSSTGEEVEGNCHLIMKSPSKVTIIKVKNSKKKLSDNGRKLLSKTSKSMELFLLQKMGETLFPTEQVEGAIYYLNNIQDRSDNLVLEFNPKNQIANWYFYDKEKKEMEYRLENLLSKTDKAFSCNGDCNECVYCNLCNYIDKNLSLTTLKSKPKAPPSVLFTESQNEFIQTKYGIHRVLAGAGSGKTTCIANRIIELLYDGVEPSEILLITYTTKGVEELKEKLNHWLHFNMLDYSIDEFQIYTFNGFGFSVIKQEYEKFGFTDEPNILDKYENMRIIKKLLDENPEISSLNYMNPFMSYFHSKGAVIQINEWFQIIKTEGLIYPEELQDRVKISKKEAAEVLKLYQVYVKYYKENNYLDFTDQLVFLYDLFKDKSMIEKYGYSHIMVDEFQDSDTLQIEILRRMISYSRNKSFIVVGDDSQSIYSWRGATSENIINFPKLFPESEDIDMMENFRSTTQICALANKINDINKRKVDKYLISHRSGNSVKLMNGTTPTELIDIIKKDVKPGVSLSDIAIISRNKKELLEMQYLLTREGIPSQLAVSELLIDNRKVKMLTNFAIYLSDFNLTLGLAEYYKIIDTENFDKSGDKFDDYLKDKETELKNELSSFKGKGSYAKYQYFMEKLHDLGEDDKSLRKLEEVINSKKMNRTIYDLKDFLQNMNTFQADYFVEKDLEKVDAIVLTTAHSSKGREFNQVYIYMNNFKYPTFWNYYASERNSFMIEEERRLLFVAITRAKNELTLFGNKNNEIYKEVATALYSKGAL